MESKRGEYGKRGVGTFDDYGYMYLFIFFFRLKFKQGVKGMFICTPLGIILLPAKTRYVSSFDALDTNLVLRSPLPSFCRSFILQASRCNIDLQARSG